MDTLDQINQVLGPLAVYLNDPEVTEIMVDGPRRVIVERSGEGLAQVDLIFDSPDAIHEIICGLMALDGRSLKPGENSVNFPLPMRQGLIAAVLPPLAVDGPFLLVRKFASTPITWELLLHYNSITAEAKACIERAIHDHVNILVAGGMASGKTTMLNRIAELIPENERLVVVEQLQVLQIQHPKAVFLDAGPGTGVPYAEAMRIGSMMRPDWMVFSEVMEPEDAAVLEVLSHGNVGMVTMYAESAEDALRHLEMMYLKNNPAVGIGEIRDMICGALQLVVYQSYMNNGRRKVVELVEICGVENGRYRLERLFRYNPETDLLTPTGVQPSWKNRYG